MDNQIQNKLSEFEVQPPAAAWQRIADALDENPLGTLGSRLSEFEVAPNDNNWKNISTQLDDIPTPAKIIPFHRRYAKPLKYGSAVAVFAAVALIANLMISKKTGSEPTVRESVKKILNNNINHQNEDAVTISPVNIERDIEASETIVHGPGNRSIGYANPKRKRSDLSPMLGEPTAASVTVIPGCAERNTIEFNKDAERYMAYSMENGSAVKLPKKMYDAITCPNKDVGCLQKIKQLQEKMAASTVLTDFTGVLDILDNLGENQ